MMSTSEIPYLLPILLAFIVGTATFSMIFEKSTAGIRTAISLVILGGLSLIMAVFTLGYLFGPDCVFCYEPRRLRGVAEYLIGVFVFGLIGLALVWWVGRAKKQE